jgi:hypothetical protein
MGFAELLILAQAPASGTFPVVVTKEWAAGWGTLSLINAGLAQSKGRSGLAWFLLSLLLGPIATLLIVALEPVPAKPSARAQPGPS